MAYFNIHASYFLRLCRHVHSNALKATYYAVSVLFFIVLFGAADTYLLVSGANAASPMSPQPWSNYYLCDSSGKGFCATTFSNRKADGAQIVMANTRQKASALKWRVQLMDPVSALKPFKDGRYNKKYAADEVYYIQLANTNQNKCISPEANSRHWELVLKSCDDFGERNDFWVKSGAWLISPAATNATGKGGSYVEVLTSIYQKGDENGLVTIETGGKAAALHQNWKFVTSKPRG